MTFSLLGSDTGRSRKKLTAVDTTDKKKELLAEGVANKAVNDEVDAGVENAHCVGHVGKATDPGGWKEVLIWVDFL